MYKTEKEKGKIETIMSDRLLRKNVVSNYYNQPFSESDLLYYTNYTAVLCVNCKSFFRLYIISEDGEDCCKLLRALPALRYVVSVPSKADIAPVKEIMKEGGFNHSDTFVRLVNTKIKPGNVEKVVYANKSQIDQILDLLNRHFTDYVSYIPDRVELSQLIEGENVIVKVENEIVLGVFIFEFFGKKAYFRIWVDESKQGLDLIINAFAVVASKNINYVYNWVNLENTKSLTIYKFFGAKPDGLYDYVFLKEK